MKTFAVLALFAFLVLASAEKKKCEKTSDCEDDECCIHSVIFASGSCSKRGGEGKTCSVGDMTHHTHKERYIVFCPCATGLECKAETTEVKDNLVIHRNPRCVKEGTEVTEKE